MTSTQSTNKSTTRNPTTSNTLSNLSDPLKLALSSRKYHRQFASIYDFRLRFLRNRIKPKAIAKWGNANATQSQSQEGGRGMEMDGMKAIQKDRILQVNQGEICWVVGTLSTLR